MVANEDAVAKLQQSGFDICGGPREVLLDKVAWARQLLAEAEVIMDSQQAVVVAALEWAKAKRALDAVLEDCPPTGSDVPTRCAWHRREEDALRVLEPAERALLALCPEEG